MSNTNKPGIVFWIIGIVALVWNGMGVNAYLQQVYQTEASRAGMNSDQIDLINNLPGWMTGLFAIAVFSGVIACIALLMKKKIAVNLFVISFITATIQQLYWLFGTNSVELFADMQPYLMPILIIVFAAFLVWYSKGQFKKGILS